MTPVPRPDYCNLHFQLCKTSHMETEALSRLYPTDLYVVVASLARIVALVFERLLK